MNVRKNAKLTPTGRAQMIARLRRKRWSTPRIARARGLPPSTVGLECRRLGLGRLRALDPPQPVVRYERDRPGELLYLDIETLGRIGRVGHRIHGDCRRRARPPLEAVADGARRSGGVKHLFTRSYTPRTNGKGERFIRTALQEWACARPYGHSNQRTAAIDAFLRYYDCGRSHGGIDGQTPQQRLSELAIHDVLEKHGGPTLRDRGHAHPGARGRGRPRGHRRKIRRANPALVERKS